MGGISVLHLLTIAVIVILLFGSRKLSTFGSDLGGAIKGFKKAISDDKEPSTPPMADVAERIDDKSQAAANDSNAAGK